MERGGVKTREVANRSSQFSFDDGPELIGASSLFHHILSVLDAVASNDSVVLLEGESGTGKELFARRIHANSARSAGPFIPVNCPAISESLFESQFFGHQKGAFTGASTDTLGVVRAAESGTLLLDEIGELPLHLQPKLLRLLQEREVTPVGTSHPISVDIRFIASTNRSLAKSVAEGIFRSDLYHRLNIVRVEIPPLRSRTEDIEPLVDYYLGYYGDIYNMPQRVLSLRLRTHLREYPWPGNVRELASYVERLYATNLPPMPPAENMWLDGYSGNSKPIDPPADRMPLGSDVCCTLAEAEKMAINQALSVTDRNQSKAARILNIHRSTLLRKIRRHGLDY